MRRLFALLVLSLCSVVLAADPPKPTLSPKELAEGWVMLFDGESTFGWQSKCTGNESLRNGVWTIDGTASLTLSALLAPGVIELTESGASREVKHAGGSFRIQAGDSTRSFTRIVFKPADTKPIFTGKDLSGWKVFKDEKREKSKFEVTKDGELHLTNGPGDLQTEAKYADFVLQLEFKTNGDALNSGVFFRCIPDQYQNGYECQIHNGFKDGDRTKPADGGTGAIYRRQPARKIVANDKEWTHLTLIAHGPTFATWVNGYPVCVWTDERPKDENPRKGLRLDAGHLSIQGHDLTTDLLFRNIRLAEIKK